MKTTSCFRGDGALEGFRMLFLLGSVEAAWTFSSKRRLPPAQELRAGDLKSQEEARERCVAASRVLGTAWAQTPSSLRYLCTRAASGQVGPS